MQHHPLHKGALAAYRADNAFFYPGDCHARKENWLAMTLEFDKYQFTAPRNDTERRREKTITHILAHDLAARPAGKFPISLFTAQS